MTKLPNTPPWLAYQRAQESARRVEARRRLLADHVEESSRQSEARLRRELEREAINQERERGRQREDQEAAYIMRGLMGGLPEE